MTRQLSILCLLALFILLPAFAGASPPTVTLIQVKALETIPAERFVRFAKDPKDPLIIAVALPGVTGIRADAVSTQDLNAGEMGWVMPIDSAELIHVELDPAIRNPRPRRPIMAGADGRGVQRTGPCSWNLGYVAEPTSQGGVAPLAVGVGKADSCN